MQIPTEFDTVKSAKRPVRVPNETKNFQGWGHKLWTVKSRPEIIEDVGFDLRMRNCMKINVKLLVLSSNGQLNHKSRKTEMWIDICQGNYFKI